MLLPMPLEMLEAFLTPREFADLQQRIAEEKQMASRYSPECAKPSMSKAKHERMESPAKKAAEAKKGKS